jgi:hypothetical protein
VEGTNFSTTSGRNFSGVVSLKEGFENGRVHERSEVLRIWKHWVTYRAEKGRPWLGINVSGVETLCYSFDKDSTLLFHEEPVVTVRGEIASYQEHLTDQEVFETLASLFGILGSELGQTTVRFTYHGHGILRTSYRLRFPDTKHPLD